MLMYSIYIPLSHRFFVQPRLTYEILLDFFYAIAPIGILRSDFGHRRAKILNQHRARFSNCFALS